MRSLFIEVIGVLLQTTSILCTDLLIRSISSEQKCADKAVAAISDHPNMVVYHAHCAEGKPSTKSNHSATYYRRRIQAWLRERQTAESLERISRDHLNTQGNRLLKRSCRSNGRRRKSTTVSLVVLVEIKPLRICFSDVRPLSLSCYASYCWPWSSWALRQPLCCLLSRSMFRRAIHRRQQELLVDRNKHRSLYHRTPALPVDHH